MNSSEMEEKKDENSNKNPVNTEEGGITKSITDTLSQINPFAPSVEKKEVPPNPIPTENK